MTHIYKTGDRVVIIKHDQFLTIGVEVLPIRGEVVVDTPGKTWFPDVGDSRYIQIRRDDGKEGGGDNGAWCAYIAPEYMMLEKDWESGGCSRDSTVETKPCKHMAGIDAEEIDTHAYREFMKGLG